MLLAVATMAPSTVAADPGDPTTTTTTAPPSTGAPAAAPAERPAPAYVANPIGARQRAAAYAYTWALSTNPRFALFQRGRTTVPSDNPEQRGRAVDGSTLWELDCTNFVSQALRVAGFGYTRRWSYDPRARRATTAWVRANGPESLSTVFRKLHRMRLMSAKGAGRHDPPPPGIQIGDVVAWDLDGVPGHMFIDHQLVVTEVTPPGRSWADIRVSYHTYDHRNRAMDEYFSYVALDAPDARLYVFHVNYPS